MFKKKCHSHNDDGVWLSLVIFIIVNLRMMWKTMPIIIDKSCVSPYRLWWNKQSPPSRPRWSHIANTISLTCRFCVTEKLNAWYFWIHLFWIEIRMPFVRDGIFTSENNWIRKEWISDTTLEGRGEGIHYACCFTRCSHSWMLKNWSRRWSQAHSCHSQLRQAP